ncbi:RNA polymerase sigma factor [Flavobacterium laiguense]|uniref:RNA polymerase subunit sigma-70 n=1 Tax=Flavobacterium laiguense TaxID=2169409 RepID=A0A2U1JT66_9FLAO|nr:RNA polymerase sigma factor [Flavobacterium laiguense]PWA08361.1 RNA polymerase subunit sigma-70 [Flavobacterium laiguense]
MKVINLHQEENEIITLAVKNNRQAQQCIYSKYASKMLSVCRQYIKDVQLAEDVMITAFMKVFVNLSRFENKGSFEGWIRRTMINECISFIRVQKKVHFLEDTVGFEEVGNETDIQFSIEDIQGLIDSLPDGYKIVFNLFVIEGYKHKEIASMLGINEGTSKSQFAHARRILKSQISILKNKEKYSCVQTI